MRAAGVAMGAVGAAALLAVAALGPGGASTPSVAAERLPVRLCKERAEGGEPLPFRARADDIRIGPVIFSALERAASLRPEELRPFPNGRLPGVKSGVLVKAGRVVTLSIALADRAYARLNYDMANRSGGKVLDESPPAVKIRACPRDEPAFSYDGPLGPTTGFSGGFALAGDAVGRCVAVEVRVKGSSRIFRRAVSFGAGPCPSTRAADGSSPSR